MTKTILSDYEVTFRPPRGIGREFEVKAHVYRCGSTEVLKTLTAVGQTPGLARKNAEDKARDFVGALDAE